jgi:hypothetical protein
MRRGMKSCWVSWMQNLSVLHGEQSADLPGPDGTTLLDQGTYLGRTSRYRVMLQAGNLWALPTGTHPTAVKAGPIACS